MQAGISLGATVLGAIFGSRRRRTRNHSPPVAQLESLASVRTWPPPRKASRTCGEEQKTLQTEMNEAVGGPAGQCQTRGFHHRGRLASGQRSPTSKS